MENIKNKYFSYDYEYDKFFYFIQISLKFNNMKFF